MPAHRGDELLRVLGLVDDLASRVGQNPHQDLAEKDGVIRDGDPERRWRGIGSRGS